MHRDDLDLPRIREHFAQLFDRAATTVQRAGYDLDDVIVERFLICEAAGRQAEVPIEFLTRADHIRHQLARACHDALPPDAPSKPADIIALGVRVWLDRPT